VTKINLDLSLSVGFIEKEFVAMHGHANIKLTIYLNLMPNLRISGDIILRPPPASVVVTGTTLT
jgi:hypothetical protein